MAAELRAFAGRDDVIVLALPRGGVPVGFEVAGAIGAPLDVLLVRKLGVPGQEELALGAIASGGHRVLNDAIVARLRLSDDAVDGLTAAEMSVLAARERAYRGVRPPPAVRGRVVIVVDDGLATGATMRVAVAAVGAAAPARVVVAVPVAPPEACAELADLADEVVCPLTPVGFRAVGMWYDDFSPTGDDEVRELLAASAAPNE